jgi:hypothetical protein
MLRRYLTLANKITFLEQIKNPHPVISHRQLAELTRVPEYAVARSVQQQGNCWMNGQTLRHRKQGTSQNLKRGDKIPDVEEALNQLFSILTGRDVRVSGPMLKRKSEESAKKLGHNNFKATYGCLNGNTCLG